MIKEIVVIGLIYALYKSYTAIRGIECGFSGLSYKGITSGKVVLRANFYIKNTTSVSVALQSVVGTLYIQGIAVGTINNTYNGSIKSMSTTTVPVDVACNSASLAQSIWDNISSGDVSTLTVGFSGTIKVAGVSVPINKTMSWEELMT